MTVHNHGPAEGRGLDCRELTLPDGALRGRCLVRAAVVDMEGYRNTGTLDLVTMQFWRTCDTGTLDRPCRGCPDCKPINYDLPEGS